MSSFYEVEFVSKWIVMFTLISELFICFYYNFFTADLILLIFSTFLFAENYKKIIVASNSSDDEDTEIKTVAKTDDDDVEFVCESKPEKTQPGNVFFFFTIPFSENISQRIKLFFSEISSIIL